MLTHKQPRTKALGNAEVKVEFDQLADEFSLLEEFLKARAAQGLTHALAVSRGLLWLEHHEMRTSHI